MKQIEATPQRPFYSVCYQYERNPWVLYSVNRYDARKHGRTMQGTDSLEIATKTAKRVLAEPGICLTMIHVSTDCYNHQKIAEFRR